jgi:DNA-binding HxlR family transcriptional regulator
MPHNSQGRRSQCPVNFALELFGDRWSLLIVRDIVFSGRNTYNDFLKGEEGIATNILASRLEMLEGAGIIERSPHPTDGRKEVFVLTDKGLDLVPVILEMANWSVAHAETSARHDLIARFREDRIGLLDEIRQTCRGGGSVFESTAVES